MLQIASGTSISEPHSTVQTLTLQNFDTALHEDPANGLWFLKFYAPWCGHCKKMAPMLEKVALYITGKMAIGKIDCTSEKQLCERFNVKGYPTLKFFRDGDFYDYPGERDADSIIDFAEKMSLGAVSLQNSHKDIYELFEVKGSEDKVAFVAFDHNSAQDIEHVDEFLQSTTLLQVFTQVARKRQPYATFTVLSPNTPEIELQKFGFDRDDKAFIIKIEKDATVSPIVFSIPSDVGESEGLPFTDAITTPILLNFAVAHAHSLIASIGPRNFRTLGNLGKPLAIFLTTSDPEKQLQQSDAQNEIKIYAQKSLDTKNYTFCTMDGEKYLSFIKQYAIKKDDLPAFFVLDVPAKKYWIDDQSIGEHKPYAVEEFLNKIEGGFILPREKIVSGRQGLLAYAEELLHLFWDFRPYSYGIALTLVLSVIYVIFWPDNESDHQDETPPKKTIRTKKED